MPSINDTSAMRSGNYFHKQDGHSTFVLITLLALFLGRAGASYSSQSDCNLNNGASFRLLDDIYQCCPGWGVQYSYTHQVGYNYYNYYQCMMCNHQYNYKAGYGKGPCNDKSSCGPGQKVTNLGGITSDLTCGWCDSGTYRQGPNGHRETSCYNKQVTSCSAGQSFNDGGTTSDGSCTSCPAGQYQNNNGHTWHGCFHCGSGQYSSSEGWTNCGI